MHDKNLICKGDKMIFQSGLISALFSAEGEIFLEVTELLTRDRVPPCKSTLHAPYL